MATNSTVGQFVPEDMFIACGMVIGNTGTQFANFISARAPGSSPTWIEFYQALDLLTKPELTKLIKYLRIQCPQNPLLFPDTTPAVLGVDLRQSQFKLLECVKQVFAHCVATANPTPAMVTTTTTTTTTTTVFASPKYQAPPPPPVVYRPFVPPPRAAAAAAVHQEVVCLLSDDDEEEEMLIRRPLPPPSKVKSKPKPAPKATPVAPKALPPPPPQSPLSPMYIQIARSYNMDVTFVANAFVKCHGNHKQAMEMIDQYHVDLVEAKQMDQIRLLSEHTAVSDKSQSKRHRQELLDTFHGAMEEFSQSVLLKHVPQVKTTLQNLSSAARPSLIQLLDEEKKAIKWYKEPARSYMRSRSTDLCIDFSATQVSNELETLKTVLYAKSANGGAPMEMLAAFDMEKGLDPNQDDAIPVDD